MRASRRFTVTVSMLTAAGLVLLSGPASAMMAPSALSVSAAVSANVSRVAGADRFETSAKVSAAAFAPGVPVAYVATGYNFPDALAAAAAAGKQGGPVLLTAPGSLPGTVRAELTRLKPGKIVVLGQADAVSDGVRSQLASLTSGSVSRVAGADRFETSAKVSAAAFAPGVPVAYVATGYNFPDALAAAAAAGKQGGPVLLTAPGSLPGTVRAELTRLKPGKIVVLGQADAVSDSIRIQLAVYGAAPAGVDGDGHFTIATYPDTQQEVLPGKGDLFAQRSRWLVSHRSALDLRFVIHTGDVVNWDTSAHEQYQIARDAMQPLNDAGIPYQLSIGNHDTQATGPGGAARDESNTAKLQRDTRTFNAYFQADDYSALAGQFETGKVDNTYSTFSAEKSKWLVINLELWPRVEVVNWAAKIIAANPTSNVIIQTHSFFDAVGNISGAGQSQTFWQYGNTSPQYMYDKLVAPYGNVKMVTSGHIGTATSKVITTAAGNKVAFVLQAIHSNTDNPVRLSDIDVDAGTIDTQVYAPSDGVTWDVNILTGLSFLRG
nr:cell wall-binding repeat-containing protein [Microbacterium lemovicicum]